MTRTSTIFDASVVIPALDAEAFLPALLNSIEGQSLLPCEIIIVDSSSSGKTAEILRARNAKVPTVHEIVDFAYPGHARNLGVKMARGKWVAFLDCRTLPNPDWMEKCASSAEKSGAEFVGALCAFDATTRFQKILRAATYGFDTKRTVPGSMISKAAFARAGEFAPNVRAGEDLEWMDRLKASDVKLACAESPTVRYTGFVESLPAAIRKWYVYALANAYIEVRNSHKKLYLLILISILLLVAFRWNAVVASGYIGSVYYLPNITKILLAIVFATYFVYRGVIRPLQFGVAMAYLLPVRWLQVAFVGLCLDLAKAPGLLWGATLLVKRRLGGESAVYSSRRKIPR